MPNAVTIGPSSDNSRVPRQDFMRTALQRYLRKAFITGVTVCLLNLAVFVAATFYLGGDALKGKIEAGRYYVWGTHHGTKGYTEVSHAAFEYSRWHAYSVIVTWPLILLALFKFDRTRGRSKD
jgi:hypothetical protein